MDWAGGSPYGTPVVRQLPDLIARNAAGFQIPVGIVTSIAGAPFFVYILYQTSKERNIA